jgi:methyl-accepting chemotaxis protein
MRMIGTQTIRSKFVLLAALVVVALAGISTYAWRTGTAITREIGRIASELDTLDLSEAAGGAVNATIEAARLATVAQTNAESEKLTTTRDQARQTIERAAVSLESRSERELAAAFMQRFAEIDNALDELKLRIQSRNQAFELVAAVGGQLAASADALADELERRPAVDRALASNLQLAARDATTAAQRLLLTKDPEARQVADAALRAISDIVETIDAALAPEGRAARNVTRAVSRDRGILRDSVASYMAAINDDGDFLGAIDRRLTNAAEAIARVRAEARERLSQAQTATRRYSEESTAVMVWTSVLAATLATLAAILVAMSIVRPLRSLTHTMEELAAGDTGIDVPSLGRKDELGQMAAALQVFKENARKVAALEAEAKEAEERLAVEKARAMGELAGQFEIRVMAAVKKVEAESRGVKHSAGSMATAAQSAQQKAARVAAASGGTADGVRTVAQAAGELAASITQIGALVAKSSSIGEQAVAQSTATNATIAALSTAAERIGTVVKLIEEIAGRTNLLALNATIEAARAGEAGRGFTIVASEVKSFAQQTAKATSDIAAQIAAIQSSTQAAVAAIAAIGKTITAMRDISTTVSDAIHRQDSATNAIAANIQQAANGTAEVSANIADVTQSSEQTGEAAHGMRSAADLLVGEAEFLKHEVENFLASVRAA